MKRLWIILGAIAVGTILVVGLIQASGRDDGLPDGSKLESRLDPDEAERALEGAPAPLAELHDQGNQLLGGGDDALKTFRAGLRKLRGYPVVVNVWGSWCGPCRAEFPHFQELSVRHGKQVAFLGVNVEDARDNAAAFLKRFPVPFPSYIDNGTDIVFSLRAPKAAPITIFVDREGKVDYVHTGYYKAVADLERDIKRYALG